MPDAAAVPPPSAFVLDDGADFAVDGDAGFEHRWFELGHVADRERALVLLPGEALTTAPIRCPPEPVLWCRCLRALPEVSSDGLDLRIELLLADGTVRSVVDACIDNATPAGGLWEGTLALPAQPGEQLRVRVACGPGPEHLPDADWLALCGLVVCTRGELTRLRARSQHAWRLGNELAQFAGVYRGDFYADRHAVRSSKEARAPRELPAADAARDAAAHDQLRDALRTRARGFAPRPGENAFGFSHRLLLALLPDEPPDFAMRLAALHRASGRAELRMLALCAGEAGIEAGILARAGVPVELCIVDVNEDLLRRAAEAMPPGVRLDLVVGDANAVHGQLGQFDVVVITSGLHHLVEIEAVLASIAAALGPDGEFWLIGEQVGRNGNRLWPEALAIANDLFTAWPEDRRHNHNTGVVDATLPDRDFSAGCFEGIRSEEILEQVARYFLPLDVFLHDAFLWRLVDHAYAANLDPAAPDDRARLVEATVAEAMHWCEGGRGTSLHAAFRSKRAAVGARLAAEAG
jgi:SAM-dependent methyltransferase